MQSLVQQGLRDRPAIDRCKSMTPATVHLRMDQAGKKLFAHTGLPLDQDRQIGRCNPIGRIQRVFDRIALTHDLEIAAGDRDARQRHHTRNGGPT